MSLFSWFSRKPAPPKPRPMPEPSGLLNADATVPLNATRQGKPLLEPQAPDHAANRKNERMERRELLYHVVRDAMVRAGVLSASYKFKVLSLDQRGRQFLVMMDLAREYGGETTRLSEIEALIAQTAKTRYDIVVTAVYWRINDHVAVGIPQKGVAPLGAGLHTQPAAPLAPLAPAAPAARRPPPLSAAAPGAAASAATPPSVAGVRPMAPLTAQPPQSAAPRPTAAALTRPRPAGVATAPAPLTETPATAPAPLLSPAPAPRAAPRYEPIEADEVAAFKRALANAAGPGTAAASAAAMPGVPVRSGPLLPPSSRNSTGFEDTEMPGADGPAQDLSSTQYGDLN